jgi:hypothetical protein
VTLFHDHENNWRSWNCTRFLTRVTLYKVRWVYRATRFYTSLGAHLANSRGRRYCSGKLPTGWNTRELDVPRNLILVNEDSNGEQACRALCYNSLAIAVLVPPLPNSQTPLCPVISGLDSVKLLQCQIRGKPCLCHQTIKTTITLTRFCASSN